MKLHHIVLLAAAALLSTIDASLTAKSSITLTLDSRAAGRSLSAEQHNTVAKRLLRAETTANKEEDEDDDDEEDRGLSLPVTATEKLSKFTKSNIQKTGFESKFADGYFKVLKLDQKNGFLFGGKQLEKWSRYVITLNRNDPEASITAMLSTLTKYYKQQDVARWAQSAKISPSAGSLATILQKAQFIKWIKEGHDALGVRKILRNAATGKSWDVKRDEEIVRAFKKFVKGQ